MPPSKTIITLTSQSLRSFAERFWQKVNKTPGCWEWIGSHYVSGYGNIGIGSRTDGTRTNIAAHRASWEMHNGVIPNGLWVLHRCDNPKCVRPDHLFLGTHTDNMRDMIRKKRRQVRIGSAHPDAKLTEQQVEKIRKEYSRSLGNGVELSKKYGVSNVMIYRIVNHKNWQHIT